MIKFIRINDMNKFIGVGGEVLNKYDPNNSDLKLILNLQDGSVLKVNASEINQMIDGRIIFDYSGDRYIIDDGFQDNLIRSGYIILNDHDKKHMDVEDGIKTRMEFFDFIKECVSTKWKNPKYSIYDIETSKNNQNLSMKFSNNGFEYTCSIDTINNIVTKNQKRTKSDLPLYQFIREMDKYGTMYITIFCKRIEGGEDDHKEKYIYGHNFIIELIKVLNKNSKPNDRYHFTKVINKRRLNNCEGL